MRKLVQDGDPDLALELVRVRKSIDERASVDRDLGRQVFRLLEEAEDVGLVGVFVLDHDRDVDKTGRELRRERRKGALDVGLEVH